ncbi:MAG TPA: hypothetical protein VIY86_09895 [Pirellulaceae bacterium]
MSVLELELPDRARWSEWSATLGQLRDEMSRFEEFSRAFESENEALHEVLQGVQHELEDTEADLLKREEVLARERADAEAHGELALRATTELSQVKTDLQVYRAQVLELERERDDCRTQRDAVVEEMTAVADLIELVKSTQDELATAREETVQTRQRQYEECQTAARAEVTRLQARNDNLERELIELRGSAETLTERLRQQDGELQGYRTRWNAELDKLQSLFAQRAELLLGAVAAKRPAPATIPSAPPRGSTAQSTSRPSPAPSGITSPEIPPVGAPQPSAAVPQGEPPLPDPVEDPPKPPKSSDPVIGSVLKEFARLGGKPNP